MHMKLKERREKLGLSQAEFAQLVQLSKRTLQEYEQGRKPLDSVNGKTLYRLAKTLDCTIEELIEPYLKN